MSSFFFALVTSAIVVGILLMFKGNENKENNTTYAIKVFISVFIVSFVTITYMGDSGMTVGGSFSHLQEIDVGEPPF
jgi:uncharacterized membrane protein YozB (DUF420 family)